MGISIKKKKYAYHMTQKFSSFISTVEENPIQITSCIKRCTLQYFVSKWKTVGSTQIFMHRWMTVKMRLNPSHRNVWKVRKSKVDLYNIYTARLWRKLRKRSHILYIQYDIIHIKKIHIQNHVLHNYRYMQIYIICRHTFYISTCIINAYINALIEGFSTENHGCCWGVQGLEEVVIRDIELTF